MASHEIVSVSVIIPNYNRAQVIGETIDNVLRQTLSPHEIVVVDDGSTDNSVELIRRFGDRVTLIQQSNQGPGAARNAGLKVATGEFIQFMDSDDLMSLNKLEVQSQTLMQHQADIVYGPWVKAWMRNQRICPENVVLQQRPLPTTHHPLYWFLTSWSMVFQQCLVRRTALTQIGGYREDMQLYEDGDLFIRLLLSGATLVHEADSLTFYRLEDYGKLTASGEGTLNRATDTARFHTLVIQQLQEHLQFRPILKHINFRSNVWQSWNEIAAILPTEEFDIQASRDFKLLEPYGSEKRLRYWAWFRQKQKGLQQHLWGHRWASCYQPGKMTPQQQQIIQSMGLTTG